MEESLRVKIVVDSTEANNSFKQINNETSKLSGNTNATTKAAQSLDKALNSIGIKGVKISALVTAIDPIKAKMSGAKAAVISFAQSFKIAAKDINASLASINLSNLKGMPIGIRNLNKQMRAEHSMRYLDPTASKRMQTAWSAVAKNNAAVGKGLIPTPQEQQALQNSITSIMNSRNKTIKKMFNQADFTGLQNALNQATMAAATKSVAQYQQAMGKINTIMTAGYTGKKGIANTTLYRFTSFSQIAHQALIGVKDTLNSIGSALLNILKIVTSLIKKVVKIAAIATAAIAVIGAAILTKLAFSVSKLGDEIDKNSQKLGMSYQGYQKWGYILERCGLDVKNLQSAMRVLYRTSQGKNADYFKQIGINPEGMSKENLFASTIEALQNISDSSQRAQMAYKLFGQQSAELAPLLNTSAAEVQRLSYQYDLLGAAMNNGAVRASVNLRDALTDLKAAFQGLKNTLGQVLIPLITDLVVRLTVFIAKVNMVIQTLFGVEVEYEAVAESSSYVTEQAQETVQAVQQLKTLISGFDELNIFPSQNNNGDLQGLIDELGDLDWGETPTFGDILPQWAIEELENFRDNILPGIVQKIQDIIDKFNELKENFRLWNEGESDDPLSRFINWWWDILDLPEIDWDSYGFHDFFEDIKSELMSPTFDDNSFLSFLNTLIDFNWDNLFGDVDFEHPFSLESLFGENLAHLIETGEWDWSQTGIGRFFESLKQEIENIGAAFRGEIEGETILEKLSAALGRFFRGIGQEFENMGKAFRGEIEGETILEKLAGWVGKAIRAIGNWNIFKKSWWEGKWQNIKDAWNNSKLKKFFTDAWGGIKTFFGGIANWNIFKKDWWSQKWQNIKTWWNDSKIKKFFTDAWTGIKNFFGGIKDWNIFKKEWWEGKWKTIKTAWNNSLIGKFFTTAWTSIKDWFNKNVATKFTKTYWQNKFQKIKDGFNGLLLVKFFKEGWKGVTDWFNEKVKPKFTSDYWKNKFQKIKDGFNDLSIVKFFKGIWGDIKTWFDEKVKPIFTADHWKQKFEKIKSGLENTAIVQTISTKWAAIKKWFSDNISGIFTKEWWQGKWDKIKDGLTNSTLIQTIITKWNAVKKWWNDNVKGIFTKAWWQDKWNKIKEGLEAINLGNVFKGIMNGIIGGFETAVNRIIDSVTGPVRLLLVALGVLGEDFQMPHLSIPRLAKGGVIDEATVALVGEYSGAKNNPEIITPESKMREVFETSNGEVVNVLVQGFRQIITAIDDNKTEVNIDGQSILKSVAKANRQYRMVTGSSML